MAKVLIYIFIILLALLSPVVRVFAQAHSASITGSVSEAVTAKPIPYATVVLLNQAQQLVTGNSADSLGQFTLTQVPAGRYTLKAGFIGYQDSLQVLEVQAGQSYQLPVIGLKEATLQLKEVVVRAQKTTVEDLLDKKVVNVGQDLLASGATAAEIMANVPLVQADASGNISLRGSRNVTILVDGKQSPLSNSELLQQLAAASIDKIEIITSPSAKYQAEGATGIINILTNKSQTVGFYGNVSLGAATGDKYNGSLELNYGRSKFNSFIHYSANHQRFVHHSLSEKTLQETNTRFLQPGRTVFDGSVHAIKAGGDFFLNPRNVLSFYTNQNMNLHTIGNDWLITERRGTGTGSTSSRRLAENPHEHISRDYNLNYRKTFAEPAHVLESELNYNDNRNQLGGNYRQQYQQEDQNDLLLAENIAYNNKILTLTADYTRPITKMSKLEAGAQTIAKVVDNDYRQWSLQPDGVRALNTAASNRFEFNQRVDAIYTVYSHQLRKFSFQTGLRLEQTRVNATLVTTAENFSNNFVNLFPSLHGSYDLGHQQKVKLGFSRRITRPDLWNVNPFSNLSNPLRIMQGNPALQPEFINAVELGYQKGGDQGNFSATTFYRYRTNIISYTYLLQENGTTLFTFANTGNSHSYGLELSGSVRPVKSWNIQGNFNSYWHEVNYTTRDRYNSLLRSWTFTLRNQWDIGKTLSLDLQWKYNGFAVDLQETTQPLQKLDVGLRWKFWKERAHLSARVSDVFNTYKFRYTELGTGFVDNVVWNGETRIGYLTLHYAFGSAKPVNKRERKQRSYGERGTHE